jgi:HSP20 family protein
MGITEKTKEKVDDATKEIKSAIDGLGKEVSELTKKVKDRLTDARDDLKESAEELSKDVKKLSERVKALIPKKEKRTKLPVNVEKYPETAFYDFEHPLFGYRHPANRLIEGFSRHFGIPLDEWKNPFSPLPEIFANQWPLVDISETNDAIFVTAELPGVDKNDLEISLSMDGLFTISGEKKQEEKKKRKGYYQLERSYGSFQRTFSLPCEIETEKVEASFKDGVLKITMPKTEAASQRMITIPVKSH